MIESNRNLRDTLINQGYDIEYHEFGGDHDFAHWRTTLPLALIHMLGN